MNALNARVLQEVRLIRWPLSFMTVAGLIPLIKPFLADKRSDLPEALAVFGFFGGAAVLTALSFRDALRIPTVAPTCGQRVSRCKLWAEKMAVLVGAAACAGIIACSGQALLGALAWRDVTANLIEPVLLLVIIVSSTGFWTMLARSMAGGILLTAVAQFVLYLLLALFATGIDRMAPANTGAPRLSHVPEIHSALSWFVGGFGLSYAVLMLWLGRQRFARLQA